MKAKILIWSLVVLLCSCASETTNNEETNDSSSPLKKEQLNITILLDLSDRVTQPLQPSQNERDIAIVSSIVEIFKNNMDTKGAFKAKDKLKILFTPAPDDASINNIANTLTVDLSKMDNKQKKEVFDNITTDFANGLTEIYKLTLNSKNWIGSDIWRFFKYDAKELCVEQDKSYRNILVIVTDGYIYHKQSTDRQNNRTAYLTGTFLQNEGFRHNPKWKEKFDNQDYGFINSGQTFEDLDILVLEVNPSSTHKNDEDIIRAYLNKWFTEMKVNHFEIFNTDLTVNTNSKIERFF